MSETIKIHHRKTVSRTDCGTVNPDNASTDWTEVTCPECRLEMPLRPASEAPEYRVPESVKISDGFEGAQTFPTLADHKARRLHAVRESEEFALQTAEYWAKVWRDAASLRVQLENESGVDQSGAKINNAQNRSEPVSLVREIPEAEREYQIFAFRSLGQEVLTDWLDGLARRIPTVVPATAKPITWEDVVDMYHRLTPERYRQAAPVNAVDIRTEVREDEGMTQLSDNAKSALINARGAKQGAEVRIFSYEAQTELKTAGLIGRNDCLTRKGTIARERLMAAAEDEAFG